MNIPTEYCVIAAIIFFIAHFAYLVINKVDEGLEMEEKKQQSDKKQEKQKHAEAVKELKTMLEETRKEADHYESVGNFHMARKLRSLANMQEMQMNITLCLRKNIK